MFALILRHKVKVGITPLGVVIVHKTFAPVLVGKTPLSKELLREYRHGLRFYYYDRILHTRSERVIPPNQYDTFLKVAPEYYAHADMGLESIECSDLLRNSIEIDGTAYELGDIDGGDNKE